MPVKKARKTDAVAELAGKLIQCLREQKQRGAGYPLTLKQLADLAGADPKTVLRAVSPLRKAFSRHALVARQDLQAPVALLDDLPLLASSPLLLEFLLATRRSAVNQALSAAKLKARLTGKVQKAFQDAVNRHIEGNTLPPSVGWLWINRSRNLFLVSDLHFGRVVLVPTLLPPSPPEVSPPLVSPPPPEPAVSIMREKAAEVFAAAFDRLDRQSGGHNFVSLVDLRPALAWERTVFDAELRRLRLAGQYTLSPAEGRHGISAAEQEAGIPEDGALLLYVSRRAP
jgi:hypothetical protein